MKDGCLGLMRFCGSIGFLAFALAGLYFGRLWFGVDLEVELLEEMSRKGTVLAVGSIVPGLLGLAAGQILGLQIPVRSNIAKDMLDAFWHFSANGSMFWIVMAGGFMGLLLGENAAMALVRSQGVTAFSIKLLAAPLILAPVMSICILSLVQALAGAGHILATMVAVHCLPFAIPIAAGIFLSGQLTISPFWGLGVGILYRVIVVPVSVDMMRKDRLRRETLR